MRYTYSRWDDSQTVPPVSADDLMDAMAEDLIADGDVQSAMQHVTRWGVPGSADLQTSGLHQLLQNLRAQRQGELERYNLNSPMEHIQQRVDNVIQMERHGIERRLLEQPGEGDLHDLLARLAERKNVFLNSLPQGAAQRISTLAGDYEFLDETARDAFEALTDDLRQQVLHSHFDSMQRMLERLTPESVRSLASLLHDINSMLEAHLSGREPEFVPFMAAHGTYFPGVSSLDQLVDQMQEQAARTEALLESMSPERRRSLEETMKSVLRDPEVQSELGRMAEMLQILSPRRETKRGYPFSGDEALTLEEALQLMRRLHDLEQLENQLANAQESGDLEQIDVRQVYSLMGSEAGQAVDRLRRLTDLLEEAGYISREGDSLDLTARGVRKIGHKVLQDVFRNLKRDTFGKHPAIFPGFGADRSDETKPYEFGDAFLLDIQRTLINSVSRRGSGKPLALAVSDFEVFRTEYLTASSTVLMLDMSRSMPLRGCFVAAKKVAFALHSLIRTQFPRDSLYVIGFSDFARELRPETLHRLTWGDYVYGTNMQHGFMLARRLLARHRLGNKQIILITDGEPTAHFEDERVLFSYPPTYRTFNETLREVKRCTQERIVINTFMLERSHYLADFVNQMTRINRGRAFFATPDRLGDYVLVDYVASKHGGRPPRF